MSYMDFVARVLLSLMLGFFVFSAIAPATGNMDLNFLTTMIGEDLRVFFFCVELIQYKKPQSNSC